MEYEYSIECPICDISTAVVVKYDDDVPAHCPMCGGDVDAEPVEEE